MPEMTKAERLVCALSREEPDRVPIYDLVDHRALISRLAGQELTLENALEVIPRALDQVLDTTRVWMPAQPGRRVDERGFTHERVDWWNEWQVQTPFQDMDGLVKFVKSEIERLEAWQPKNAAQELAALQEWQRRFGETVIPASGAGEALQDAYILVGMDRFIFLELDHPELVSRWLEAQHQATMRRLQSESGVQAISPIAWVFADIAFKDHLMFSKTYLRSHGFFRRLAEIMGLYHSYGLKVIFHSDGDITPLVPELIEAGADAIAPVDTPAGMDIFQLKADFGRRVSFVGGMNLGVLSAGSPDEVRSLAQRIIQTVGRGGSLVLGSSSEELYESLPEENILAMWETVWDDSRHPIHPA